MIREKYTQWIRLSALLSFTIAVLVIIGWLADIKVLQTFYGPNTMKFNAGLAYLFLGIATWLACTEKSSYRYSSFFAALVLLIGGVTIAQDVFQFNVYIDELFVKDDASVKAGGRMPGRMAPTTAISLTLMGIALILAKTETERGKQVGQYLLHLVTLITFIALLGYLFDVPAFYKLSFLAYMAAHTAFVAFVLSISISLFNPSLGLTGLFTGEEIGNVIAKRTIPVITVAIVILSFLRLQSHRWDLINVEFGIALFGVSFLVLSVFIIGNTVQHLNNIDSKRHVAEDALRLLNKTLEQKVTERTKDLRESEGKFFKIFNMSPVALMMSDAQTGRFIAVNQSFLNLTGYTKTNAEGKTSVALGLVPQDEWDRIGEILKAKGYLKNVESYFYNKSGEKRAALISLEITEIAERSLALIVMSDITEQKAAEQKLLEAKKLAEESSVAKERFMANMSHEIRTPMNAIIGFTNLIEKSSLDAENAQYLNFIKTSGENLLVLINDILDYSKIEAGMMQLETVPFKIGDLLNSIEIMFSEKAREKKLKLIAHTAEKIPGLVLGDPTRLTQILVNLIGNAIKFTKEGSVEISVGLISTNADQVRVGFSVKDTGIGIPAEKQADVFERFMQASSETTRNYGGTGLGLSIVKRLVELQGGEISIRSEYGKGTEFYVTLPYLIGEDQAPAKSGPDSAKIEIQKFDKELRVLLAEDNVMNQVLAKKVLSKFGAETDIAENGGIAIEMVRTKQYDVILMDIQMPIMDGYTAAKTIREELHNSTPIIAMTAHIMAGEREKCIGFGMTDYISKPFKAEALYKLITQVVSDNSTGENSLS